MCPSLANESDGQYPHLPAGSIGTLRDDGRALRNKLGESYRIVLLVEPIDVVAVVAYGSRLGSRSSGANMSAEALCWSGSEATAECARHRDFLR